jgi:hypothetical protein
MMIDATPPTDSVIFEVLRRPRPAIIERAAPIKVRVSIVLERPGTTTTSTGGESAYRAALVGDIPLPLMGSLSRGLAADLKPLRPFSLLRSTE